MATRHSRDAFIGQSDLIVGVGLDRMELLSPWNYSQPLVCIDAIDTSTEQVGIPTHSVYGTAQRHFASACGGRSAG